MLLYATLALCALAIALLVIRYDMYEREPWYMLLLATALGAGFMWVAGRAQIGILTHFSEFTARNFNLTLAAAAATTEEFAKLSVVVLIALAFRRHFNDPMDGIIYGSFAGLGCAIEESIMLIGWPYPGQMLPLQEPIRLAGHLIMGGIAGFGMGLWRVGFAAWPVAVVGSFAAAVGIHFAWDIVAFSAHDLGRMLPWHTLAAVATMGTGLAIYAAAVMTASGMSRRTFDPDSPKRLIGWPFTRSGRSAPTPADR